jgi:hypothetical protein
MLDRSRGSARQNAGRSTKRNANRANRNASRVLLFLVTLGVSVACSSEDDDPEMSAGGTGGQATGAAGASGPLRGEGFEPTPTFDITSPDREPPSREELVEGIGNLSGAGGSSGSTPAPADAGSTDGGDAS